MPGEVMWWVQLLAWVVFVTAFVVTTRNIAQSSRKALEDQTKATQLWLSDHERREDAVHNQLERELTTVRKVSAEAETRNQQAHLRLVQAVGWIQGRLNLSDPPPPPSNGGV